MRCSISSAAAVIGKERWRRWRLPSATAISKSRWPIVAGRFCSRVRRRRARTRIPERALNLALEAHGLAADLVPAAAVAGRLLAARGNTPRATKILQRTWRKSPHPDLAVAYAYARLGDSPRDRLQRVRELAGLAPNIIESPIAVANAAIEARAFDVARAALEPLLENRLTQRVCTMMARIEGEKRQCRRRARVVGTGRQCTARSSLDRGWHRIRDLAAGYLPSPVRSTLSSGAFRWKQPSRGARNCWRRRSRNW